MTDLHPKPLISLQHVNKYYAGRSSNENTHALKNINLDIQHGHICGIIGRSGAGKSSLLRTLNGLESISSGEVHVLGHVISELDHAQLIHLRQDIGMVFQHFNLLSSKTVWENIALPLKVAGFSSIKIKQQVEKIIALVGLDTKAQHYPSQLSGGQKQRVGIARALIHQPKILLCDEATSALDPESTHTILQLLKQINQTLGITIVLITHEMQVIQQICDEVVVIDAGEIIEQGQVWQVFSSPQHQITQELLQRDTPSLPTDISIKRLSQHRFHLVSVQYAHAIKDPLDLQILLQDFPSALLLYSQINHIQQYSVGHLLIAYPIQPSTPRITHTSTLCSLHIKEHGYVESII
ncbi:methionine ABC transporter ATP-binding protein [Acinetobacter sp. B5B]|uniref:methionine ABC transporter ATP-binding protein n=1 Tax=Acinetobacter baretiae TaxID=2605383 RepID=UPI0018C2BD62|nr:methionine ABC transporter ATP-binding protein [Acinetobacter baretiae]MBF7683267.1 methionine ABC transporter ATP-binding protein [Acinetobacter baretiae]MBF7684459.1 methionine ABC transporter ATP-binding protein [Acinetobacter baretiae]